MVSRLETKLPQDTCNVCSCHGNCIKLSEIYQCIKTTTHRLTTAHTNIQYNAHTFRMWSEAFALTERAGVLCPWSGTSPFPPCSCSQRWRLWGGSTHPHPGHHTPAGRGKDRPATAFWRARVYTHFTLTHAHTHMHVSWHTCMLACI